MKMVKELSSMDMYYLTTELKQLENSKVDRIYHTKENPEELLIIVHVTGKGKHILRIILPSLLVMDYSKEEQGTATGLCMMLRKYLEGSMLTSIEQLSFERVLTLTFQRKEEKNYLILELFGKGNIIFCDSKLQVLNTIREEHWKDRDIKRKQEYEQPISNNILKITEEEISEIIKKSKRYSLVKILAMDLGLGGTYAEELCEISGIDKESKEADTGKILKGINILLSKEIKANSISGKAYPFELRTKKAEQYYESFNESILKNIELKDEQKDQYNKQKDKIDAIIDQQTAILEETQEQIIENQKKAESIYGHYKELEDIINIIKNAQKQHGWKEVKKRIKDDEKFSKIIKDISEKDHTITIELDEL
jgi:predicted ribosome quality control (RQC) complex YloA/Tae2 family protein